MMTWLKFWSWSLDLWSFNIDSSADTTVMCISAIQKDRYPCYECFDMNKPMFHHVHTYKLIDFSTTVTQLSIKFQFCCCWFHWVRGGLSVYFRHMISVSKQHLSTSLFINKIYDFTGIKYMFFADDEVAVLLNKIHFYKYENKHWETCVAASYLNFHSQHWRLLIGCLISQFSK